MKPHHFRIKKPLEPIPEDYRGLNPSRTFGSPVRTEVALRQQSIFRPQTHDKHEDEWWQSQMECRHRIPLVELPALKSGLTEPSLRQRQLWLAEVCRRVFSIAFNYSVQERLTYEQTRIFIAESIMRNILAYAEKWEMKGEILGQMDRHISDKIIPYLLKVYPATGDSTINRGLEALVEEMNSYEELENDFIYLTGVKFTYRREGNYNDLIMQVFNQILTPIDKAHSPESSTTNYEHFLQTITKLFTNVQDSQWMQQQEGNYIESLLVGGDTPVDQQAQLRAQKEAEKYRERVRSYTSFKIGRKVSQNVKLFGSRQIDNQHLVIRHPSILRLLTKWSEELENKFRNPDYMKQRWEDVATLGGDINSINDEEREKLDHRLQVEWKLIEKYLQELRKSFYYQQAAQMEEKNDGTEQVCTYIEKGERSVGKYAVLTVKSMDSFIVHYLNRLIHGLVRVAYDWHRGSIYKNNYEKWSYPPNLVTFKVGDLIRCKCSSKEREVIAIFKQLVRMSTEQPQTLKIIRVKNRLRKQTNDILINVKFNNRMLGEIQLGVNAAQNKHTANSNAFSHYLYQLQRSTFGPFSQLCSIWKTLDPRTKVFEDLIRKESRKREVSGQQIRQKETAMQLTGKWQSYGLPFRCSFCHNFHSHNDLVISNQKNSDSMTFKCVRCRIKSMSEEQLCRLATGRAYADLQGKFHHTHQMPYYGFSVELDSKTPHICFFRSYRINGIIYYLSHTKGEIHKVVNSDFKSKRSFMYHNLVFALDAQIDNSIFLRHAQVKAHYIIPEYLRGIYRSEKKVVFLNQKFIDPNEWPVIVKMPKYEQQAKRVTKLEIAENKITNMDFICETYPNLESLHIGKNPGCAIESVVRLPYLKYLCFEFNGVSSLPADIAELKHLQELDIYRNNIRELPNQLCNIKTLKALNLKYNQISALPADFSTLTNLDELLLKGNPLGEIPDQFTQIPSLTFLNISKCGIKKINPLVNRWQNLRVFDVSENEIEELPDEMRELIKLQKLKCQKNKIKVLPEWIVGLKQLQVIQISHNQIKSIDYDLSSLKQLSTVDLSDNSLQTLHPSIFELQSIKELYIHSSQLESIKPIGAMLNLEELSFDQGPTFPQQVCELSNLLTLKIQSRQNILAIPPSINQLSQLQELRLAHCNLTQIPQAVPTLESLINLHFEHNQVSAIPAQYLARMNHLEHIAARSNHFTKVPKQLLALKSVDFTNNQIEQIEIETMKNYSLNRLMLSGNKLKEVPANLRWLRRLREVDLSHNQITELAANLTEMKRIEHLQFSIYGNPIERVDCMPFMEEQRCEQSRNYVKSLQLAQQ